MRRYRLFGLTLGSDFPFESRLQHTDSPPELAFRCSRSAPVEARLNELVYESPAKDESGGSLACLYRQPGAEILRFGELLDFYLFEDLIHCHLRDAAGRHLVELRLLGSVLAYWLESRGVCALHASAVVHDGRAVVFLASHQGGKSGLAATMVNAGLPLLSDDLLPIEKLRGRLLARPGYPQMRMWPDQLPYFVERWKDLEPVHPELDKRRVPVGPEGFGAFHPDAVPPGVLYLPERRPPGHDQAAVQLVPVPPREVVIELVRNSFSPFIVEAVGLQPRRLELLAELARAVPVKRLVYLSGFDDLARVRDALLNDLATV